MRPSHPKLSPGLLAAWILLAAGCGGSPLQKTGDLALGVVVEGAAPGAVRSVVARVEGASMQGPLVQNLARQGGQWKGTLEDLPAAGDYVLEVAALDARGQALCQRRLLGVGLPAGGTALRLVLLRASPPARDPRAPAPVVDVLAASLLQAEGGQAVDLALSARAPAGSGGGLSYHWTASAGRLEQDAAARIRWIAPAADQEVKLVVEIRSFEGGLRTLDLAVQAKKPKKPRKGKARVQARFNTWPVVSLVAATRGQLRPGQSTLLSASATDSDGDALQLQWSNLGSGGCAGSFSDPASAGPTWAAPATAPASGACWVQVRASDGRGGEGVGYLMLHVGPAPPTDLAPRIHSVFQSLPVAGAGGQVTLRVVASDPEGQTLQFLWAASAGTLGSPATTPGPVTSTSEVTWTAPTPATGAGIQVWIRDPGGNTSSYSFAVSPP